MKTTDVRRRICNEISSIGTAIPGTIRSVKLKCGSGNCKCKSGKNEDKHGPYFFWNRKVNGKMTSASIPKDKVSQFKSWINNRKKLEKLVADLIERDQKFAVKALKE